MKSPVIKRSIVIAGHKTSVSLEDAFWRSLKDIAVQRQMTLSDMVGTIDSQRRHGNLSSAIRLFVLDHFQTQHSGQEEGGGTGQSGHDDTGPAAPAALAAAPAASRSVWRAE